MENPAPFSLLPDLVGRSVLDLGCGYGENCREFSRRGVARVLELDISENMLEVANRESWSESVRFLRMSMNDLASLEGPFDLAVSSLAVQYIENFDNLLGSIYRMLNPNGTLIFSQEHPFTTARKREPRWSRDGEGHILHDNLTDDSLACERKLRWIVDGVVKVHRSFSMICNALIRTGFVLEQVLEPVPDRETMERYPAYKKYIHKPDFLLIRARRL